MARCPVYRCSLVRDGSVEYPHREVSDDARAAAILYPLLRGADREHFAVILLNAKNAPLGASVVSVGGLSMAIVEPSLVFKPAILAGAAHVIIAHNHPSGDTTPSPEDLEVSKRLSECGRLLGIAVLDSIIIGREPEDGHTSLGRLGSL